jgi:hypothetical protein
MDKGITAAIIIKVTGTIIFGFILYPPIIKILIRQLRKISSYILTLM